MHILLIITIAISLSMDALSLSLAYGTLNLRKKDILTLSVIVGIYHFFMPLIGYFVGMNFIKSLPVASNFVVFIILTLIGLEMVIDTIRKEEEIKVMRLYSMIIFGLTVSIDSFSVGLGLDTISKNIIISSLIFSITSFIFTITGLFIGKKINQIFGRISTLIGGCVLILIAILYVV